MTNTTFTPMQVPQWTNQGMAYGAMNQAVHGKPGVSLLTFTVYEETHSQPRHQSGANRSQRRPQTLNLPMRTTRQITPIRSMNNHLHHRTTHSHLRHPHHTTPSRKKLGQRLLDLRILHGVENGHCSLKTPLSGQSFRTPFHWCSATLSLSIHSLLVRIK